MTMFHEKIRIIHSNSCDVIGFMKGREAVVEAGLVLRQPRDLNVSGSNPTSSWIFSLLRYSSFLDFPISHGADSPFLI